MAEPACIDAMTTAAFEPSRNDPNLRHDLEADGTPAAVPGLDTAAPEDVPGEVPADPGDPTTPTPTES
jgi:hypothetical protein